MAQLTEQSLLDKLLKSRYPLTYYLSRQQQFAKAYSTEQTVVSTTPHPPHGLNLSILKKFCSSVSL